MGEVNPQSEVARAAPPAKAASRRDRASATRRRIAEAAIGRFSERGYAATTMEAIAADANVAVQTVYFTFHTKAELLIAAMTVAGGEPGSPEDVMQREWMGLVVNAPDGPRRLALLVEHGNEIYRRIAPILPAVQAAASVDTEVAAALRALMERRRSGMRHVVEDVFARRGELRDGLDPAIATDVLAGLHRAETWTAFTVEAGWPAERYKAWQYATLARALLPSAAAEAALTEGAPATAGCSFSAELAAFR